MSQNENKELENAEDRKDRKTLIENILSVPVLICVAFAALIAFTLRWAFSFWANLTMDEIVYHLTSPLEGTGQDILMKFFLSAALPAVVTLVAVGVFFVFVRNKRKNWYAGALAITFVMACVTAGASVYYAWTTLKIDEYLKNQDITSNFIEEHYVDPNSVTLTFPKKKRNLIFIYLESVESTFADKKNGGAFDFNCIPELTELAQEYEDFSGSSKSLNGGHVLPGTTFTMGGMFGQTCGLPLQVGLRARILDKHGSMNEMYTQEHFFPGITGLGDILAGEGYHNVLFIGSEAAFGGRKLFFSEHGDYEIDDFNYAVNRNWLKEKENSWGYSDWRLYLQAQERLRELSEEDKPFNLTMLTVDTHFENGIRCQYCKPEFPGNSYADVYACSSRQLADFIAWCQDQDWYENTTIILSGDHTTMDSDFCDDVAKDYQRKTYTCCINADAEPVDAKSERSYTTMDLFPTTLAAMGVKIEGDRLGLGTNLFSSEDTLYETYGKEMDEELNRRSLFMEQVSEFDPNTQAYKDAVTMYEAKYGTDSSGDDSGADSSNAGKATSDDDSSSKTGKPSRADNDRQNEASSDDDSSNKTGESSRADNDRQNEASSDDSSSKTGESAAENGNDKNDESVEESEITETADESGTQTEESEQLNEFSENRVPENKMPSWVPPDSPFPNNIESLYEHFQEKDRSGSDTVREVLLDPWKEIRDHLASAEAVQEESVGASDGDASSDSGAGPDESGVSENNMQNDESKSFTGVNLITVQVVENSLEGVTADESRESDTVPSLSDILATPVMSDDSSTEENSQESRHEKENLRGESEADESADDSSENDTARDDDSRSDQSSAVNLTLEESESVTDTEAKGVSEKGSRTDSMTATEEGQDEERSVESTQSGRTQNSGTSGNPLEIGPTARQMYPELFRDPHYDFYPESKLRTDPYAAFSGNRQPKTKARITGENIVQLKNWIDQWDRQSERK